MSLINKLNDDMKSAMKVGDKLRLSTLRMLISAIRYVAIDAGELSDEKVIGVIQKEAKKRRESIDAYDKAGRVEAANQEREELLVVEEYLPKMMSEEEVRAVVAGLLSNDPSITNYGLAMQKSMKELQGKADGGVVAKVVKELYK